jgi:Flp pilus assembly protein TadB
MKPGAPRLPRSRYLAVTAAAGLVAVLSAVFLVGAPPLPAAIGVALAVGWLIWRAPAD